MLRQQWLAAGLVLALVAPALAQSPRNDASPGAAGAAGNTSRNSEKPDGRRPAEPATPSDIAPREGAATQGERANTAAGKAAGAGTAGVAGSTRGKIEGSEPVDSGMGRSGAGTAGGATKGGGDAMK